jgi:protein involved in polysaccharide export with SLBB domain
MISDWAHRAGSLLLAAVAGASVGGCNNKMLDPSQIGRFRPTPAVNVILESLGVAEEPVVAWEAAEEPRPSDVVAQEGDYALQPGDVVEISIFELLQESAAFAKQYVVSETGKISIPQVGTVQAAGLTERQLEEEIRRTLSPNILRDPSVTVTMITSQQRAFSILGNGVPAPGRYFIPRYNFRLMEALATAQVNTQFNASHIYVTRREGASEGRPVEKPQRGHVPELELIQPGGAAQPAVSGNSTAAVPQRDIPEPTEPAQKYEAQRDMLDLIQPQAGAAWPRSDKVNGPAPQTVRGNEDVSAAMLPGGFRLLTPPKQQTVRNPLPQGIVQTPVEFGEVHSASADAPVGGNKAQPRMEWIFDGKQWRQVPAGSKPAPAAQAPAAQRQPATDEQGDWVLRNGNWVQTPKGQTQPSPATPPTEVESRKPAFPANGVKPATDLGWKEAIQTRSIRIPADKLLAGDPRYNIIIEPGDTIHVPVDRIGEFYIMGNVNSVGTINLTGRPMTLKMAIAAAGGLGPLAAPKRVEVTRRIGAKREEIVLVDLDRIASGEQPDFFVKPNDLINVGTDATSRWRAVLRNAFRATYGFGFVYDRNFADADYGEGLHWPSWF